LEPTQRRWNGTNQKISRDSYFKKGKDIVIFDAKCKYYSEIVDGIQERGPDRNIVNLMIIYLDCDKECNLGIVLFADNKMREDIIITQETRKIVFLKCYPYHEPSFIAFDKLEGTRKLLK
jgi:hypothetical protein